MMQGFYLLAMQQARRRTLLAALACIAALISIVLAGRALLSAPAVPAHRHRHAHAAIRRAAGTCGRHYAR